jgi:hypothetical protein
MAASDTDNNRQKRGRRKINVKLYHGPGSESNQARCHLQASLGVVNSIHPI